MVLPEHTEINYAFSYKIKKGLTSYDKGIYIRSLEIGDINKQMANHKSTIKRIKTDAKRRLRNNSHKSMMKTHIKSVLNATNKEEAEVLFRQTMKIIDKIAAKKIIHANRASSYKSRLANHVNSLG